jgi:acyl dehydratase
MSVDAGALLARPFAPVVQEVTARDTILYALGVGLGADPVDAGQLGYLYEDGLAALPFMANVLGYPGFWAREADTGIDWRRVVHAEQWIDLHAPLPAVGRVVGHTRVTAFHDKGAAKGALMASERRIEDGSGRHLATVGGLSMLRGDGGSGVVVGEVRPTHAVPERAADAVCDLATLPQAALIYRLSGDLNPLHVDPAVARGAGFERPILHGMASMGVAGHAVLRTVLGYDSARFRGMSVRFTAPVYPGETIRTEMWMGAEGVAFRCRVMERGVVVLDRGRVEVVP